MENTRMFFSTLATVILLAGMVCSHTASGHDRLVRTEWPSSTDPGIPFYARVEIFPPYIFNDGEWAAIVFYRHPSCVPPDFNLLQVFDIPRAFTCPHTVGGFSLWNEAPFNGSPRIVHMSGNGAVPVWFVPWASVEDQAHAGGVLTLADLEQNPDRLVGFATQYSEELQPHADPNAGGGGHPNPKMVMHAHGQLMDGRDFKLQIRWVRNVVRNIQIRFD